METKQSNNSATPMADAVKIANQRALFSLEWENDTVFKKRELNYKTKAAFQKDLEAGKISKYTTVFIKDSKEIYKNGQYYGAGSSSVVDITNEYSSLISGYSSEIYNKLLGYANSSVITYINDTDRGEAHFVSLSNMYEKLVMSSITTDYNGAPILECYVVDSSIGVVSNEGMYFASKDMIGSATLGTYNKAQSYKPISSGDNLSSAIGKLEANVSKIITNGNGTKFLSDNGEYKEISSSPTSNKGVLSFDFSSLSEESGTISDEILNSIKEVGLKDSESASIQFIHQGITYVGELRYNAGDYSVLGTSVSESIMNYVIGYITITISSDLKTYILSSSSQEIQNSGLGDKFLSDDGTYKEIQQGDSSKQSIYINFNDYLPNMSGDVNNWSTLKPLLDECCNTKLDAEGDKNLGKKQLLATYYVFPFLRATMSFKNNSEYLLSFTAYGFILNINITDNGSSATYSVNSINIDSSGDGTKALTDSGNYKEFAPEAPSNGSVYGRKNKQWEKIVEQKIVTESEYSALGNAVNSDNILYFVTPDA